MNIDDTGNRRRATDRVTTDESLELVSSLAMEYALKNDEVDLHAVEIAIMKLRELKIEKTGTYRTLHLKRQTPG